MTKISKISLLYLFIILILLLGIITMVIYIIFIASWESRIPHYILWLAVCIIGFVIFSKEILKFKIIYQNGNEFRINNLFSIGVCITREDILSISGETRQNKNSVSYAVINIILKGKKKIEINGRYIKNMHKIREVFKNELGQ